MLRICLPIVLVVSLLLGSCVTEQDLQLQRDFLEMKRRLGETERALKELQDDASGGVTGACGDPGTQPGRFPGRARRRSGGPAVDAGASR